MPSASLLTYLAFGFAFGATVLPFAGSDYLCKQAFFKKCLIAAVISGVSGTSLELARALHQKTGMTVVIMLLPLIYLGYFQLFRWIFKQWRGTEPHVTSVSSSIGATPIDMYGSAGKDGKLRKFPKDRKVMAADFVFSFVQALVPIFTIAGLILLVNKLNE